MGVKPDGFEPVMAFLATYRDPAFLAALAGEEGPRHLDADFELVRETFRRFADDKVRPVAEHVHRTNADIPEDVIAGWPRWAASGCRCPRSTAASPRAARATTSGMVVATEELSRGSLGVGGSLITRPEILTRALGQGGTEEQKHEWLPKIASAETMVAVAVTEPDFGSDVAGIKVTATPATSGDATSGDGDGWVVNGVKTWCTFAARRRPDAAGPHRPRPVEDPPRPQPVHRAQAAGEGHGFAFEQETGGKLEGRAIDTIGYRGMHSYEVAFDNWFVPAANQIGGEEGLGKGFYLQMEGFENGRLQTAARAVGVMQAAYEAARDYAHERVVFGHPIGDYQLTQVKLARMAVLIQASRQFMYKVARLMAAGEGALEASMVKAYVCRAAEWVTREALQVHGGMGYAEEFPVSRYFVDARVLSIFEGADETLALKVIARRLTA